MSLSLKKLSSYVTWVENNYGITVHDIEREYYLSKYGLAGNVLNSQEMIVLASKFGLDNQDVTRLIDMQVEGSKTKKSYLLKGAYIKIATKKGITN